MTPDRFEQYLAAFNTCDFAQLETFFAPDVVFEHLPPLPRLEGREALMGFYRQFKSRVDEVIEPLEVIFGADRIAAEVRGAFTAREDILDFAAVPMRRGEVFTLTGVVFYTFAGGRFTHIRNVARVAMTHKPLSGEVREITAAGYAANATPAP